MEVSINALNAIYAICTCARTFQQHIGSDTVDDCIIPAIEQYSQSCQNTGSTCMVSMVYKVFICMLETCDSAIRVYSLVLVCIFVSCHPTSAPKSGGTHPVETVRVGNAIPGSSLDVDTVAATCR